MTKAMITHQTTVVKGLYQLMHYASTHPACHGWAYAIDVILTRREVCRG